MTEKNLDDNALREEVESLLAETKTLFMATAGKDGEPHASYAPYVRAQSGGLYVFVSDLSEHTAKLMEQPQTGVLIAEDEKDCTQLYARRRLSFATVAVFVERDSPEWNAALDQLAERFGEVVGVMRGLADFRLVRLDPTEGRYIRGFGAAFRLRGGSLAEFEHIRPQPPEARS